MNRKRWCWFSADATDPDRCCEGQIWGHNRSSGTLCVNDGFGSESTRLQQSRVGGTGRSSYGPAKPAEIHVAKIRRPIPDPTNLQQSSDMPSGAQSRPSDRLRVNRWGTSGKIRRSIQSSLYPPPYGGGLGGGVVDHLDRLLIGLEARVTPSDSMPRITRQCSERRSRHAGRQSLCARRHAHAGAAA